MDFRVGNYPPGSDLTVVNVIYRYPMKDDNTGKWSTDYLLLTYRDNATGKKYTQTFYEPEYTWYLAKPGVKVSADQHFIPIEDTIPITCKYRDITKSIARETNQTDLYNSNIKSGQGRLNKAFILHPRAFGADLPIKNYYRTLFAATYTNTPFNPSILYFDTEADIINAMSDNLVIGESPTCMISAYFTGNNTMYTMCLRNSNNPLIAQDEDAIRHMGDLDSYFHRLLQDQIGDDEKIEKMGLKDAHLKIAYYDLEIEMIIDFFKLIRDLDPDFVTAWNLFGYDLPQLVERIKINGYDERSVICDPEIVPVTFNLFIDERNKNKPEERTDYADFSIKPIFYGQDILYASRRKGQGAVASYALDYIAGEEAGVHKKDYHEITTNIAKFPWLDYTSFREYNIADVVAQKCIEAKVEDFSYMLNNVITMNTSPEKIFRQTVYLATKAYEFYKEHEGVIIGNNHNKFNEPTGEKFPGAFVASPLLLTDKNKVRCQGKPIMKFNNGVDFDYKALYPSLMREFNQAPHTQVGMVQFKDPPFKDPEYLRLSPGGTFCENLASYNFVEFCHRWINLANVDEMLQDLDEYFSKYRTPLCRGEGNLLMDKKRKVVAYHTDTSQVCKRVAPPMPDWLKEEINKIRASIVLK